MAYKMGPKNSIAVEKKSNPSRAGIVLPEEILIMIFNHLNLPDKKSCRLVCKAWTKASYASKIMKNVVFVVDYNNLNTYVSCNVENIVNLRIYVRGCQKPPTGNHREFFDKYKHSIKSVHFIFVRYWQHALSEVLEHLPDLPELSIGQRDCGFDGCECSGPSCDTECDVTLTVPVSNLQILTLYHVACQHILKCIAYSANGIKSIRASSCFDADGNISELVRRSCSDLSELDIDERFLDANMRTFPVISSLSPKVTKMSIAGKVDVGYECYELPEWKKFINLKELSLSAEIFFKIHFNELLYKYDLSNLTHISINCYDRVCDEGTLFLFATLRNLIGLQITSSVISEHGIEKMIGSKPRLNLKYLSVRLNNIPSDPRFTVAVSSGDTCMMAILPKLPNLELLDVNFEITETSLQAISLFNQKLQSLTLMRCVIRKHNYYYFRHLLSLATELRFFRFAPTKSSVLVNELVQFRGSPELTNILVPSSPKLLKNLNVLKPVFSGNRALKYIAFPAEEGSAYVTGFEKSCIVVNVVTRELKLVKGLFCIRSTNWYDVPSIVNGV